MITYRDDADAAFLSVFDVTRCSQCTLKVEDGDTFVGFENIEQANAYNLSTTPLEQSPGLSQRCGRFSILKGFVSFHRCLEAVSRVGDTCSKHLQYDAIVTNTPKSYPWKLVNSRDQQWVTYGYEVPDGSSPPPTLMATLAPANIAVAEKETGCQYYLENQQSLFEVEEWGDVDPMFLQTMSRFLPQEILRQSSPNNYEGIFSSMMQRLSSCSAGVNFLDTDLCVVPLLALFPDFFLWKNLSPITQLEEILFWLCQNNLSAANQRFDKTDRDSFAACLKYHGPRGTDPPAIPTRLSEWCIAFTNFIEVALTSEISHQMQAFILLNPMNSILNRNHNFMVAPHLTCFMGPSGCFNHANVQILYKACIDADQNVPRDVTLRSTAQLSSPILHLQSACVYLEKIVIFAKENDPNFLRDAPGGRCVPVDAVFRRLDMVAFLNFFILAVRQRDEQHRSVAELERSAPPTPQIPPPTVVGGQMNPGSKKNSRTPIGISGRSSPNSGFGENKRKGEDPSAFGNSFSSAIKKSRQNAERSSVFGWGNEFQDLDAEKSTNSSVDVNGDETSDESSEESDEDEDTEGDNSKKKKKKKRKQRLETRLKEKKKKSAERADRGLGEGGQSAVEVHALMNDTSDKPKHLKDQMSSVAPSIKGRQQGRYVELCNLNRYTQALSGNSKNGLIFTDFARKHLDKINFNFFDTHKYSDFDSTVFANNDGSVGFLRTLKRFCEVYAIFVGVKHARELYEFLEKGLIYFRDVKMMNWHVNWTCLRCIFDDYVYRWSLWNLKGEDKDFPLIMNMSKRTSFVIKTAEQFSLQNISDLNAVMASYFVEPKVVRALAFSDSTFAVLSTQRYKVYGMADNQNLQLFADMASTPAAPAQPYGAPAPAPVPAPAPAPYRGGGIVDAIDYCQHSLADCKYYHCEKNAFQGAGGTRVKYCLKYHEDAPKGTTGWEFLSDDLKAHHRSLKEARNGWYLAYDGPGGVGAGMNKEKIMRRRRNAEKGGKGGGKGRGGKGGGGKGGRGR